VARLGRLLGGQRDLAAGLRGRGECLQAVQRLRGTGPGVGRQQLDTGGAADQRDLDLADLAPLAEVQQQPAA